MYYIGIIIIFLVSAVLPVGAIADEVDHITYSENTVADAVYSFDKKKVYQVDGHSMEHLGFNHNALVDVVPASDFKIGDVIAFECSHSACSGAYIKQVVRKKENCFWVEGRYDIWEEEGKRKQSMDSRTTYGWLCNDDIVIYGAAFLQKA